jgi:DNA-binding NtrC family response regulator
VLEDHDVDLVLSDYRMPGMNGVQLLRRAREVRPDCVRVVLTGYADADSIVSALESGEIYRYVNKPWNETELLDVVRKALEHGRLRREKDAPDAQAPAGTASTALRVAREIIECVPVAVFGFDAGGRVVLANARARQLRAEDALAAGGLEPGQHPVVVPVGADEVGVVVQGPDLEALRVEDPGARAAGPGPAPARIVLVDDEPGILAALERELAGEPFELESFTSATEALERIRSAPPAAVLADYYMPGMDGAELLEQVREIDHTVARITLTGRPDVTVILETVAKGSVFRFLLKPWDEEEIRDALHDAVAHHRQLRENLVRQRALLGRVLPN